VNKFFILEKGDCVRLIFELLQFFKIYFCEKCDYI